MPSLSSLTEYRCTNPHPKFPERQCGKKLAEGNFVGVVDMYCSRCKQHSTVQVGGYTTGTVPTLSLTPS